MSNCTIGLVGLPVVIAVSQGGGDGSQAYLWYQVLSGRNRRFCAGDSPFASASMPAISLSTMTTYSAAGSMSPQVDFVQSSFRTWGAGTGVAPTRSSGISKPQGTCRTSPRQGAARRLHMNVVPVGVHSYKAITICSAMVRGFRNATFQRSIDFLRETAEI
jgi:hypothetical protein